MNVGIIIGRIGGLDGVALETEKWIKILEKMGNNVFIITGELESDIKNAEILPELSFQHPSVLIEQKEAFFDEKIKENIFLKSLEKDANVIKENLLNWIDKKKIDLIISQNASALPCHIRMGLGIKKVIDTGIKTICHNHDFYWERGNRYNTKLKKLESIIEKTFPPVYDNVKHVVINKYNKSILKEKLNVESIVIPNVMDFDVPYGKKDKNNLSLLKDIGVKKNDYLLFQITRIVRRKGIETAIKLVKLLDHKSIKLVITGDSTDDYNNEYFNELIALTENLKLKEQVIFASKYFSNFSVKSEKKYSLSDAYAYANSCTYFSTYEGFGNAFVEAILAKKPIYVNNYKPVFWDDIGSLGFKTVILENNVITDKALEEIKNIIFDDKKRKEISEYNFELGKKYFSFQVLEKLLKKIFL